MPWSVKKMGGNFCVVKEGETSAIKGGCHGSKSEAAAHVRALYASEAEAAVTSLYDEDVELEEFHEQESAEEFAWEGPIVFENRLTGDNRIFKADSIAWDEDTLPWAFRWQKASTQGHAGAVAIGRVDSIERRDDGVIYGRGVIIPALNEEAAEYLRLIEAGVAGGVSVDGDSAQFDVQGDEGKQRVEFSSMRLRSLTAVDIPAFNEARVRLSGSEPVEAEASEEAVFEDEEVEELPVVEETVFEDEEEDVTFEDDELEEFKKKKAKKKAAGYGWKFDESLIASGIPVLPSIEAFQDPKFDGPTGLTVTKDGRVFGHLALFNTCHIAFPQSCVTPPKNSTYKYFHTGEIETAEGDFVQVGHLTFDTGHADMQASPRAAAAHYDHTGVVAADVRAGEDEYGIWVVGALRPKLTDEDIRTFRAAPLSGDWRRIGGRMELVGALSVNVPGFPVPRARAMVASGETEALFTFLEEDHFFSQYEMELRWDKKLELASKITGILGEEYDEEDVPDDEIPDDDFPFDAPTKKDFETYGPKMTKNEAKQALMDLREFLDDTNAEIPKTQREKMEQLYSVFVPKKGVKVENATEDMIEFYNGCHDPKTGKFCGGPGGSDGRRGGGVKGAARNNSRSNNRNNNRNNNNRNNQKGGGDGDRNVRLVKKYQSYTRAKSAAKGWGATGLLAGMILGSKSIAGLALPVLGSTLPILANPLALTVLAATAAFHAGKQAKKAVRIKTEFNHEIARINRTEKANRIADDVRRRAQE